MRCLLEDSNSMNARMGDTGVDLTPPNVYARAKSLIWLKAYIDPIVITF